MFYDIAHTHFFLAILFLTGLVAATIDAISGGGGLISLPVLLSMGVPPHLALGTNKLQSSCGTFIATRRYYKKKLFSMKLVLKGLIFGFFGTTLGAYSAQSLSAATLKEIIPFLLLIILHLAFSLHQ